MKTAGREDAYARRVLLFIGVTSIRLFVVTSDDGLTHLLQTPKLLPERARAVTDSSRNHRLGGASRHARVRGLRRGALTWKMANMRQMILLLLCYMLAFPLCAAQTAATATAESVYLLKPARVFDGDSAQLAALINECRRRERTTFLFDSTAAINYLIATSRSDARVRPLRGSRHHL